MNDNHVRLGDRREALSAYEVLASFGIAALVNSETLFNDAEEVDPDFALRLSADLYILSSVVASFATQHEHWLKTHVVSLPQDVGAIRVKNPLFDKQPNTPVDDIEELFGELGGDDNILPQHPF